MVGQSASLSAQVAVRRHLDGTWRYVIDNACGDQAVAGGVALTA